MDESRRADCSSKPEYIHVYCNVHINYKLRNLNIYKYNLKDFVHIWPSAKISASRALDPGLNPGWAKILLQVPPPPLYVPLAAIIYYFQLLSSNCVPEFHFLAVVRYPNFILYLSGWSVET